MEISFTCVIVPPQLHLILCGASPLSFLTANRWTAISSQSDFTSDHVISSCQEDFKASSISGNQIRALSPGGIASTPIGHNTEDYYLHHGVQAFPLAKNILPAKQMLANKMNPMQVINPVEPNLGGIF